MIYDRHLPSAIYRVLTQASVRHWCSLTLAAATRPSRALVNTLLSAAAPAGIPPKTPTFYTRLFSLAKNSVEKEGGVGIWTSGYLTGGYSISGSLYVNRVLCRLRIPYQSSTAGVAESPCVAELWSLLSAHADV